MWFLFSVVFSGISISFRETVCCVKCFGWLIPTFRALAENLCQSQFYQRTLNLNHGSPHPVLRLGISVQPGCPIFHLRSHLPCWRHCSPAPEDWSWTPLPEPFGLGRKCPENGETWFTRIFRRRSKHSQEKTFFLTFTRAKKCDWSSCQMRRGGCGEDHGSNGSGLCWKRWGPAARPSSNWDLLMSLLRHFLHSSDSRASRDLGLVAPTVKSALASSK